MAPIAATLSALASSVSAMSPAKLAAFPVAAGLAIGSAAGVAYVSTSAPAGTAEIAALAPVPAAAPAAGPATLVPEIKSTAPVETAKADAACESQTWPYIDARCRAGQAGADRKVRIVTAPRASDTPTEAQQSSDSARQQNPGLVSSSTVLYTPQPQAETPKVRKRSAKRESRARRVAEQYYSVPSEYGRGDARIVVRPMRIDPYR